jgi:3-dehydroquinate synthase
MRVVGSAWPVESAGGAADETAAGGGRVHVQRFAVSYEYPVVFTRGLFDVANPTLADTLRRRERARRHRVFVVIDDGVAASVPDLVQRIARYAGFHADVIELLEPTELVPGGEASKNDPALVERLQRRVREQGIDRHAYLMAIGGGAVLDMAGFVAATSHRGVRHVRVPTTVLSQNDSGVGVKNGVNAFGVKNFLGTFQPPFAVLNDSAFIDVLPPRDKRAGMAEAVKVALIRDRAFFLWLEANAPALRRFEAGALDELIRRCAALHMRQIAHGGDPFERGSARPLDFGHWSAHKLETLTGHAVRHGEAVAIGIALDSRYSVRSGLLEPGADQRICRLLEELGFELWHEDLLRSDDGGRGGGLAIMAGLREFREHLGGELTITLLADLGVGEEVHEIDEALMAECIDWLRLRRRRRAAAR